jgi:RNA polymerase sigma factor (TIGR02999 family)
MAEDARAEPPIAETTRLLRAWRGGDGEALAALLPRVYDALREIAAARLRSRDGHTLQPTALVHEALLRLIGGTPDWHDRVHFLAVASLRMRAVLVDHARAQAAAKRGGGAEAVTLSAWDGAQTGADGVDVLALHAALDRLAAHDERAARIVEMTYFGGMERAEVAAALGLSVPTVDRDLRFAKAWLNRALAS